ncbi:hypothetical protein [Paenibacillus pabuli]|uniref:hypothetical protein n=1 Tax=Paenibacillus pabuli TaxID=1472 RepID=UPI0014322042|nr:hypothetical protein [Paenibacillus pabuli]MEC0126680.1 hypothetical protein [Paenibacillus pabuli]
MEEGWAYSGIMEPVYNTNKTFKSVKVWVNGFYTSQSEYISTDNAIQSIATHELGLAHAPERTLSVMVPATFLSDGDEIRCFGDTTVQGTSLGRRAAAELRTNKRQTRFVFKLYI